MQLSASYKYTLICILHIVVSGLASAQQADFLIISQPQLVPIFNKYEQRLSLSEVARLPEFMPFQVIEPHHILSDNYTQTIKVRFENQLYFLLQDLHNSALINSQILYYKSVRVAGDTVSVWADDELKLRNPDPDKTEYMNIAAGTRIIRIFKRRNEYYVCLDQHEKKYGWIHFGTPNSWGRDTDSNKRSAGRTDEIIFTHIVSRTEQVNSVISKLYSHLNSQTGQERPVPQWQISRNDGEFRLNFVPDEYTASFRQSNDRFIQEIEYILLGTGYIVQKSGNSTIFIKYAP